MAKYKFTTETFQEKFAEFVNVVIASDLTEELALARLMLQSGLDEFEEASNLPAITPTEKQVRQYGKSLAEIKIQTWIDKVASLASQFERIAKPANEGINYLLNAQFPVIIQQAITNGIENGHNAKQITSQVTSLLEGDKNQLLRQTTVLPSTDVVVQLMDETVPDIITLETNGVIDADNFREPVAQVG